jgi:uncharacterized membrane protein YkvA (DUF1232 family)
MKIQQLLILMDETGLSPEDIAGRMGVSGMTVRRWQQKPTDSELASLYEDGTRKAIYELLLVGKLKSTSASVQWAFSSADPLSQRATLASLGFPTETTNLTDAQAWNSEQLLQSVEKLGAAEQSSSYVESNLEKILSFAKLGETWNQVIMGLRDALLSTHLKHSQKLIAIGGFCYLLMPFDLIPDSLPVVGLLDDFAILSLAAAHYRKLISGLST